MITMRRFAVFALLALAGCGPTPQAGKGDVEVSNAWVRLPPVAGRPGAAYFTLRNNGPDSALTEVRSPNVERIELHDSQLHDGMMHMTPLAEVPVARGGTIDFQPGGKHAMLFGVDPQLTVGSSLPLTLSLRDGRKVETQAQLVAPGAPPPNAP